MPADFPRASWPESLRLRAALSFPGFALGVVPRFNRAAAALTALSARFDTNGSTARLLRGMRDRYGDGPVWLRPGPGPGGGVRVGRGRVGRGRAGTLVVLHPEHLATMLSEPVRVFAAPTSDKQRMFTLVQPDGVILSTGTQRQSRRRFQEFVLDSDHPVHRLAEPFLRVMREELDALTARLDRTGGLLDTPAAASAWRRVVRRVVFGDSARDDEEITQLVVSLVAGGNLGRLRRLRGRYWRKRTERLNSRIRHYLGLAEPHSLVSLFSAATADERTCPAGQVPHWLIGAGGLPLVSMPTLALLACHPAQLAAVRAELEQADEHCGPWTVAGISALSWLPASLLDTTRLWPPVSVLARTVTKEVPCGAAVIPADTEVAAFAFFHHRDDEHLDVAHRFAPEVWCTGQADANWSLAPFSRGDAGCAGYSLCLFLGTAFLAGLLRQWDVAAVLRPVLDPARPLPTTLDYLGVRLRLARR